MFNSEGLLSSLHILVFVTKVCAKKQHEQYAQYA